MILGIGWVLLAFVVGFYLGNQQAVKHLGNDFRDTFGEWFAEMNRRKPGEGSRLLAEYKAFAENWIKTSGDR